MLTTFNYQQNYCCIIYTYYFKNTYLSFSLLPFINLTVAFLVVKGNDMKPSTLFRKPTILFAFYTWKSSD